MRSEQSTLVCITTTHMHVMASAQMFSRKYIRLAAAFPDVAFCEIYGDENSATRVRSALRQSACVPQPEHLHKFHTALLDDRMSLLACEFCAW
jgi:hypothetical protein